MQRELIIKVLESLEKNFPYSINPNKLGKEIKAKELKISIERIEPVINYLKKKQ